MRNDRLVFLFQRYVAGTYSDQEFAELMEMLSDPANEDQLLRLMKDVWDDEPRRTLSKEQSERILQTIIPAVRRKSYIHALWPAAIAAAIALAVLFAAGAFYFFPADRHGEAVAVESPERPGYVTLPDGSTVILKPGSKLHHPDVFPGTAREVVLEGEGYFDIEHDPARPFIVHTGSLKTTVLGTAFNIEAYPRQDRITITVKRGEVRVSDDKETFGIIRPNQQISFDRKQHQAKQSTVNSREVTEWVEKDIFFDDITMEEALRQLEKRFDVSIAVENEAIRNCRFTATFAGRENIEQILRIICDFNKAGLHATGSGSFEVLGGECPSPLN